MRTTGYATRGGRRARYPTPNLESGFDGHRACRAASQPSAARGGASLSPAFSSVSFALRGAARLGTIRP